MQNELLIFASLILHRPNTQLPLLINIICWKKTPITLHWNDIMVNLISRGYVNYNNIIVKRIPKMIQKGSLLVSHFSKGVKEWV